MPGEYPEPADRDESELVSLTEVADLAGVCRASVSNWRRRHPDFPRPDGGNSQQPLFNAWTVADWLDKRSIPGARTQPLTYGHQFRDRIRMRTFARLRSQFSGDVLMPTGMALCVLRHVTGGRLPTDPKTVRALARETELSRPELDGALTPDLERLPEDSAMLIETINEMCEFAGAARAAERLITGADRLGAGIRSQLTPSGVADFVAELIGDVTGRVVLDPAVGGGNLLLRIARNGVPARVLAADTDANMLRLLRQRLACHDLSADCVLQDSLNAKNWPAVDLVVVDPPFTGGDTVGTDKRGQATRILYRWLGQAVGQLAPGGMAVALAPVWLLTRTGDTDPAARLRDSLVTRRVLRAAIQLPRLSHPFRTGTELVALVLTKPIPGEVPDTVLVCNTERGADSSMELGLAVRRTLAGHNPNLPPGVVREVPRSETSPLRSLLPAHVLSPASAPPSSVGQIRALTSGLTQASAFTQFSQVGVAQLDPPRRLITIGEHISKRRLRVFSGFKVPGRYIAVLGEVSLIGEPELTGDTPVGERRIHHGALASIQRAKRTSPDDLVVLPVAPLRVLIDTAGGSLVQSPAQILRILPWKPAKTDDLDLDIPAGLWIIPSVLAALLTAPRNRERTSGSRVLRDDLAAMELPVLSHEEVIRFGETLRELAMLRREAAERLAALDELGEALRSGVADGILSLTGDRPVAPEAGRESGGAT